MTSKWTVKRQTEIGSKQWGVYRNGQLVEGGFFAYDAADSSRAQHAADEARAKPQADDYGREPMADRIDY